MNQPQIKQIAKEFLTEFNPTGLVPFPYAETVAALGDVSLKYIETGNTELSGAIYLQDGIYNIIINSAKPVKRQYFTVAHELGHYRLHKDKLTEDSGSGFIDFGSLDNTNALLRADTMPDAEESLSLEREANSFAAEILMPEEKVREFYGLNEDIKETADAFRVSVAAMAVRLEKLGLAS